MIEFCRHATDKALLLHAIFPDRAAMQNYSVWYKQKTQELLKEYSYQYVHSRRHHLLCSVLMQLCYRISGIPGTRVDIVQNVINLVSVHWVIDYLVRPYAILLDVDSHTTYRNS